MIFNYDITPMAKPRMTGSDKWKKRPVVLKYFAFKDECRVKGMKIPISDAHIIFRIQMPPSWTKKKRAEMAEKPHQQKPDVDNLLKAVLDAVYQDDSGVHDIRASKIWSVEGSIEVRI